MTDTDLEDPKNHTYEEQIAELAAETSDDPEQSDNLQEIMEEEFRTSPK